LPQYLLLDLYFHTMEATVVHMLNRTVVPDELLNTLIKEGAAGAEEEKLRSKTQIMESIVVAERKSLRTKPLKTAESFSRSDAGITARTLATQKSRGMAIPRSAVNNGNQFVPATPIVDPLTGLLVSPTQ
jgi:hypothetical protein